MHMDAIQLIMRLHSGVNSKFLLIFAVVVTILFLIPPVSGLYVYSVPKPEQVLDEGKIVKLNLTISDLPPQGAVISIDTDLDKNIANPIFYVPGQNVKSNNKHLEIKIEDRNNPIFIQLNGIIPKISQTTQCGGLTLTNYLPQRGFAYYRIAVLDENNDVLPSSTETQTFEVNSVELAAFKNKLNKMEDKTLAGYYEDLYNKGLVNEANRLVDYSLTDKGAQLPLFVAIGIAVVCVILGVIIGYKIGMKKGSSINI
jgi:hypothetical protein